MSRPAPPATARSSACSRASRRTPTSSTSTATGARPSSTSSTRSDRERLARRGDGPALRARPAVLAPRPRPAHRRARRARARLDPRDARPAPPLGGLPPLDLHDRAARPRGHLARERPHLRALHGAARVSVHEIAVHVLVWTAVATELVCCIGIVAARDVFARLHYSAAAGKLRPVLVPVAIRVAWGGRGVAAAAVPVG